MALNSVEADTSNYWGHQTRVHRGGEDISIGNVGDMDGIAAFGKLDLGLSNHPMNKDISGDDVAWLRINVIGSGRSRVTLDYQFTVCEYAIT